LSLSSASTDLFTVPESPERNAARWLAREIDQGGRKETDDRSELRRDHQSYVAPNVVSPGIPERKKDQVRIK
jgi:hypothetical protein